MSHLEELISFFSHWKHEQSSDFQKQNQNRRHTIVSHQPYFTHYGLNKCLNHFVIRLPSLRWFYTASVVYSPPTDQLLAFKPFTSASSRLFYFMLTLTLMTVAYIPTALLENAHCMRESSKKCQQRPYHSFFQFNTVQGSRVLYDLFLQTLQVNSHMHL